MAYGKCVIYFDKKRVFLKKILHLECINRINIYFSMEFVKFTIESGDIALSDHEYVF